MRSRQCCSPRCAVRPSRGGCDRGRRRARCDGRRLLPRSAPARHRHRSSALRARERRAPRVAALRDPVARAARRERARAAGAGRRDSDPRCRALVREPASRAYAEGIASPANEVAFAYGALVGHVERGEERFAVRFDRTRSRSASVAAFSRPASDREARAAAVRGSALLRPRSGEALARILSIGRADPLTQGGDRARARG